MERANAANVSAGFEKCGNTLNGECDFDFYRVACSTFDRNLRLVDSRFPQVLANALLRYFFGEVIVFHVYNRDSLGSYLLSNTKYETASISKYDDGLVYEHDGEYFINLSLQIGFP